VTSKDRTDHPQLSRLPGKIGSQRYWYHPFELSVGGYKNTGKTTLLKRLIGHLAAMYRVGYVKHQTHVFAMDQAGKDTHAAYTAGAYQVGIQDHDHAALLTRNPEVGVAGASQYADCDFVLVEGWKQGPLAKILLVGDDSAQTDILHERSEVDANTLLAVVGPQASGPRDWQGPYFQRDNIASLAEFIIAHWQAGIRSRPLHGLILAGGQSQRMGRDKALLQYDGKTQLSRLAEVLQQTCDEIYLSCRPGQRQLTDKTAALKQIHDQFTGLGPLGGILSAQRQNPAAAWLVVACDLPFIHAEGLQYLLDQRDGFKVASCFASNEQPGLPEPLCTIYEPRSHLLLMQGLAMGYNCPRKVLLNTSVKMIAQPEADYLQNINRPADYEQAIRRMATVSAPASEE
jgi:molybdopterin-guanine dinucleotide biosynthesis protein A